MPFIGRSGETAFLPSSVNTSSSLTITGGDLIVDTNTLFVDESTNRVGIGTASPDQELHILGTSPNIRIQDSNAGEYVYGELYPSTTGLEFQARNTNSYGGFVFNSYNGTTNVVRVTIHPGGNIGIGDSNNTSYDINAQNLLLANNSGNYGITIRSGGESPYAMIHFADGTTDNDEKRAGRILYAHEINSLSFYTANEHRFRATGTGEILVNNTASKGSGKLQVFTPSSDAIDILGYSEFAANSGRLTFYRSKHAEVGSDSAVDNGDSLGRIDWRGYNASGSGANNLGAIIEAIVAGSVDSGTDMPTDIVFKTSPDDSSTPGEVLRITSDGKLGLGGVADPAGTFEILGNENSTTQFSGMDGLRIHNENGSAHGITADMYFTVGTGTDNRGAAIGVQYASNTSGNDLYFATNPNPVTNNDTLEERLRIASGGNVGIGLSSPGVLLHLRDSDNTTQGNAQLKVSKGVGAMAAPGAPNRANCYIHLGSSEWRSIDAGNGGYYLMGFGYTNGETGSGIPAYMGYVETSTSSYTQGDLIFGTRSTTTGSDNPTQRLRITSGGDIKVTGNLMESTDSGVTFHKVVTAQDIGQAPNQIPLNADINSIAFQDPAGTIFFPNNIALGDPNVGDHGDIPNDPRNQGGLHIRNSKGISFYSRGSVANSRHWRIRHDDMAWGTLEFANGTNNSTYASAASDVVLALSHDDKVGILNNAPKGKLHIGDAPENTGDVADSTSLFIKQSSNAREGGIYIERNGERKGYYIHLNGGGGSGDSLTFARNYSGTKGDVLYLDRDGQAQFVNKVGIGVTAISTAPGLSVHNSGTKFINDSLWMQPSGSVFMTMRGTAGNDNWFGFGGHYQNQSGSSNLLLQANFNGVGQGAGHAIRSVATGLGTQDFKIQRMYAASATNARPTFTDIITVNASNRTFLHKEVAIGGTGRQRHQIISGIKEFSTTSNAWLELFYSGHSHAITIHYSILQGGSYAYGGAHGKVEFFTNYGSSSGPQNHTLRRIAMNGGQISGDPEFQYLNSGGSVSYLVRCRVPFSSTSNGTFKIAFTVQGITHNTMYVL